MTLLTVLAILGMVMPLQSQPVAEISYIRSGGKAHRLAQPNTQLVQGQELQATDTVVLEDGAGMRVFFRELQRGEPYEAPCTLSMADELKRLANTPIPSGRVEQALAEIGRFVSHYLNPVYNRYAGTRGIQIRKRAIIHTQIVTFRQYPTIVIRGVSQPQRITIYSDSNQKLADISVPAGSGIQTVSLRTVKLAFGQTYHWSLSGEQQSGQLKLIDAATAQDIEAIIQALETEALARRKRHSR